MAPGYDGATNLRAKDDGRANRTTCAEEGLGFLVSTSERGRICVLTEYIRELNSILDAQSGRCDARAKRLSSTVCGVKKTNMVVRALHARRA